MQRVNYKTPINPALALMEGQVIDIYNEMRATKVAITAAAIKNRFLGRGDNNKTFNLYFENLIENTIAKNQELSASTIKNYRSTLKHVKDFLQDAKWKNITLQEFDIEIVRKWDTFLRNKDSVTDPTKKLNHSTVIKYHVKLRALFNMAIAQDLLLRNPYSKFKIKKIESERTFLTRAELDAIESMDLSANINLDRARDKFIFAVYTGLRFTDADNLRDDDIEFDGKKHWISFRQQKTKGLQRLPLLAKAKAIYEKYEFERLVTGYILPRLSNQKSNKNLKAIAKIADIKKPISFHCSRHSCATTIFLSNGVPLEVVRKQLGHSSIKTTEIYAKITNEMLAQAADKLDEIFK